MRLLPQDLVQKAESAVKLVQEIKGTQRINNEQKLFFHFLKNLIGDRIKKSIENNSATKNDLACLSYFNKVKHLNTLLMISGACGIWSIWTLLYIFLNKKSNLQWRDVTINSGSDNIIQKAHDFELMIQSAVVGLGSGLILMCKEFFD